MKILITGGGGFVGRRFVRRLLNQGHTIVNVDNLVAGLHPAAWAFPPNDWGKHYFLDYDIRKFCNHTPASDFDLIIHCAAIVGGRLKIQYDPLVVATDLSIDAEFFNWVVRSKPSPKVIYFSSSAVYPVELQTKEQHCDLREELVSFDTNRISMPDMSYGWAKLCGEYLAKFARENYGLEVAVYRPFGGYGEDQSFDYPFPSIIRRVLNNENPIMVWGSGDQQRDFIYIEDVIDIVLATYEKIGDKPFNLGTGIGTSFRQLADEARNAIGRFGGIENDATKPEGVFYRVADTARLVDFCGSARTPLLEGILKVASHMERLTRTKG